MAGRNILFNKDLIRVIAACHRYGVIEFKYDELYLTFHRPEKSVKQSTPQVVTEEIQEQVGLQNEIEREIEDREQTEMLIIENPLEHERRIERGELIDDEASDD